MTWRVWAVLACTAAWSMGPGCSLSRSVLAGGGIDGGSPDVGGHDGGRVCPASCDDGNACTDDGCDASGSCTHANNAASCDDGVRCNGADTCSAGACTQHDRIDPCPGASHCDTTTDACTGCATSSDCPATTTGAWSECDLGSAVCTVTGTQTRTVTTYACASDGTCAAMASLETHSCTGAPTDGHMCAAPTYGDWSTCAFADPCTQTGAQTRVTTTSHCLAGTCTPVDVDETQPCMRTTDGLACGSVTIGAWSTCLVGVTCSATGTQTRITTTPACMGGTCVQGMTTEMQPCTAPSGAACGDTTCAPWSACTQTMPNSCDRTGTQSRLCSTPTCSTTSGSESCSDTSTATEMRACSASVSGMSCVSRTCSACRESGRFDCRPGHTGTRRCSTTNGTCMDFGTGPFCAGLLPMYSNESCSC